MTFDKIRKYVLYMPKNNIKQAMTPEVAMEWMRVYDECGKNKSQAARTLGVDRRTLIRYIDAYWPKYAQTKVGVRKNSDPIDFDKVKSLLAQNELVRGKMLQAINPALDQIIDRLNDPAILAAMSIKELTTLIKEIAPYILPKVSADEGEDQSGLPTRQANVQKFIQNVYNFNNHMKDSDSTETETIQIN